MNPMEWFVWKPERIFMVSLVFFLGYLTIYLFSRKRPAVRSYPLLISFVTWITYGVWELFCSVQQYNIRVDLLFIYPVLIIVSIFGISASVGSLISNLLKK